MTTINLKPKELDDIIDTVLLSYVDSVKGHLTCLCKKNRHKNCPRHNFIGVSKMVFDHRQPIGDEVLHLQSKKLIIKP